jgi:hypothetical protein
MKVIGVAYINRLTFIVCGCILSAIVAPWAIASAPALNKKALKVTGLAFAFSGNVVAELEQGEKTLFITFARNFGMEDEPPPEPGRINVSLRADRTRSRSRWLPHDAKETKLLVSLLAERFSISTDELERRRITTMQEWLRNRDSRLPRRQDGEKFGITWIGG